MIRQLWNSQIVAEMILKFIIFGKNVNKQLKSADFFLRSENFEKKKLFSNKFRYKDIKKINKFLMYTQAFSPCNIYSKLYRLRWLTDSWWKNGPTWHYRHVHILVETGKTNIFCSAIPTFMWAMPPCLAITWNYSWSGLLIHNLETYDNDARRHSSLSLRP